MIRLLVAWLFLAAFFWLFIAAANGARWLWLHVHWPTHRQRMRRAALCLEAAKHWWNTPTVARRFASEAYRLCADCGCPPDLWCADCGCPPDLWPAGVLAIHVGMPRA